MPAQSTSPAASPSPRADHATGSSHSRWTIALHWASVVAIALSAVAGLLREVLENDALRALTLDVHRQSGLFVLIALGLRVAARLRFGMKNHAGPMPWWMTLAAHAAHLALYALLLALPLVGLAVSNAHDVRVSLFGLLQIPSLVEDDPDLADRLTDIHVWLAWTLLACVVAHIAAAVWHHRVRRDGVLSAMLPWVQRRR